MGPNSVGYFLRVLSLGLDRTQYPARISLEPEQKLELITLTICFRLQLPSRPGYSGSLASFIIPIDIVYPLAVNSLFIESMRYPRRRNLLLPYIDMALENEF